MAGSPTMVGLFVLRMRIFPAVCFILMVCGGALAQESSSGAPVVSYDDEASGLRITMPKGWTSADEAVKKAYREAAKMAPTQRLVWVFTRGVAGTEKVSLIAVDLPPYVTSVPDDVYAEQWVKHHPEFNRVAEKPKTWGKRVVLGRADFIKSGPAERHLLLLTTSWEHKFYQLQAEVDSESALEELIDGMNIDSLTQHVNVSGPVVRMSESLSQAYVVKKYPPIYPALAAQARIQGQILMRVMVNPEGKVADVHVVSGHPMLASEAVRAAKQWKFKPYLLDGKPVHMETQVTIRMSLAP